MTDPTLATSSAIARRRVLQWLAGAGLGALVAACGGGGSDSSGVVVVPGPTPTPTPTPTPSPTPTPTPTPTPGATAPITMLSDSLGAPIIDPLAQRSGRAVPNWAIGGQTSTQIANRALGVRLRFANGRIVGGVNPVVAINGTLVTSRPNGSVEHLILSTPADMAEHAIRGTVGGLVGTLRRTVVAEVETYDFAPDAAPSAPVTASGDLPFAPDFPDDVVVYCAGRNNFFRYDGHPEYGLDRVVADARRVIAAFPKVLVLAVSNGDLNIPNEYGPDGGLFLQIQAINQALAVLAGDRFLDHVRIAKARGLALAGLTPDAQSRLDAQHDVISHQLRADGLHENAAGGDVYAQIILTKLTALGW